MTIGPPKSPSGGMTMPRSFSILLSIAMMALFILVASRVLVDSPIRSPLYGHLLSPDISRESAVFMFSSNITMSISEHAMNQNGNHETYNKGSKLESGETNVTAMLFTPAAEARKFPEMLASQNGSENTRPYGLILPGLMNDSTEVRLKASVSMNSSYTSAPSSVGLSLDHKKGDSESCDLYHGTWAYDTTGPLYTNNSCPIITQMQNCQGNGRPDKDYENWRWKPNQCDLPRFDARKFLELMRGKTLAFIGDSVARNQMESMICILWQVEVPKNRGNRRMQRWYFKSTSTSIVRVWSSWLVHQTTEPVEFAPEGVVKLHLDAPDESFMQLLPGFDVVVLSSGHWFAKQSVYVLDNKVVGGQLWWPDKSHKMDTNNINAFGISVETILSAIISHPNYTGLTIVRSFSPDHYEGGAWNTGGSCTGKISPASKLARNEFTDIMHEKQVKGFRQAAKKTKKNNSKLKFMDITDVFGYRHDGHPGPYRSLDPNKVTKRGPNGQPPPQDCLHWCMPGPIDTWNELVLEIVRGEFEGA